MKSMEDFFFFSCFKTIIIKTFFSFIKSFFFHIRKTRPFVEKKSKDKDKKEKERKKERGRGVINNNTSKKRRHKTKNNRNE